MNAEQSILKHVGLAGVLKGYGIYDNVITAMEDYAQERVKNCSIPAVSGQFCRFGCRFIGGIWYAENGHRCAHAGGQNCR